VADRIADHGGQLVKTIGDEVLFTADNPASLVQIASGLLREFTSDPYVGALRIGLSYGPAIRRLGDIFGVTVNLASRMTDIAEPNTAVASPEIAAALHEHPRFKFEALAERSITGIGRVTPLVVISTPDEAHT
jgi:adenylate cyclase